MGGAKGAEQGGELSALISRPSRRQYLLCTRRQSRQERNEYSSERNGAVRSNQDPQRRRSWRRVRQRQGQGQAWGADKGQWEGSPSGIPGTRHKKPRHYCGYSGCGFNIMQTKI